MSYLVKIGLQDEILDNGFIEQCKTHLDAKDFTQREGIDFKGTFAHVAKLITVHFLLAVAAI